MQKLKAASLIFDFDETDHNAKSSDRILSGVEEQLLALDGYDIGLAVLSEGISAAGMAVDQAESISKPGRFLTMFMNSAHKLKTHIAAPIKLSENNKVYNSTVYISPEGEILGRYSKIYLTEYEVEEGLSRGDAPVVVDTSIGRIGGVICFDLNFPELRHEYIKLKPDILTFSSLYHGSFVQQVWAYECRSFFISALQMHGAGIIDPLGSIIKLTDCYNCVAIAEINLDRVIVHLDYNMAKFPDIIRKYKNEVKIEVPANLGAAIIYSDSDKRTANDIAEEFELILLDDYLNRNRI